MNFRKIYFGGLIGFFCCFSMVLNAQSFGYKFQKEGKNKIRIKFEQVNNLIILPITLNDTFELRFIVDTGVRHTIITKKTYTDSLNKSRIDHLKTQLGYDLVNKAKNFENYNAFMESYLNQYVKDKVIVDELSSTQQVIQKEEKELKYNFILNHIAAFLGILILFSYLWCLINLVIFKNLNKEKRKLKKKSDKILYKINKQS